MKKKLLWRLSFLFMLFLYGCKTPPEEETYTLTPRGFLESLVPNGDILELDSFEYDLNWECNSTDSSDLSFNCNLSKKWKSEGDFSLECNFTQSSNVNEKCATFISRHPVDTFWNNARFIAVEVNNPNKDCIKIAVSFDSYKSAAYLCPPGEHLILIEVSDYAKTLEASEITKTFTVETIGISIEEADVLTSSCKSFYIDNLRLLMDNSKHVISDANSNTLKPLETE